MFKNNDFYKCRFSSKKVLALKKFTLNQIAIKVSKNINTVLCISSDEIKFQKGTQRIVIHREIAMPVHET